MVTNEELEQEKREFLFFVFRRFIRLENTVGKIIEQKEELNDEDIEALMPYFQEFYQRKRMENGT